GHIGDAETTPPTAAAAAAAARLKSAKSMIVFTPHRITLEGGASQVLRLRVERPTDLPAGEYRSHLTVREVPPETPGLTAEQAAADEPGEISFKITTVLGLSIPIIVQQGPMDVRAAIEGPSYARRRSAGVG